MAAGLTLKMHDFPAFALAFDEMVNKRLINADLEQKILSDGELTEQEISMETAELLRNASIWGHEFPEPIFHGGFDVIQARIVGQQHLKLVLRPQNGNILFDAVVFFVDKPEQWLGIRTCNLAYKLDINEFKGQRTLQLQVQYLEKVA